VVLEAATVAVSAAVKAAASVAVTVVESAAVKAVAPVALAPATPEDSERPPGRSSRIQR
jgi:hypothetical protein